jgi:hypothetical protein
MLVELATLPLPGGRGFLFVALFRAVVTAQHGRTDDAEHVVLTALRADDLEVAHRHISHGSSDEWGTWRVTRLAATQ